MSSDRGSNWILKIFGALSIASLSAFAAIFASKVLRKSNSNTPLWKDIHATIESGILKYSFNLGTVCSYETNSFGANSPNEDAYSVANYPTIFGGLRFMCGIYDGHSTNAASQFCSQELLGFIERRLRMIDLGVKKLDLDESVFHIFKGHKKELVKIGIINAFKDADEHFICESILNYLKGMDTKLDKCISGSCTVVTLIEDGILYTANLGDCRAVLGSFINGNYEATNLSSDHNTSSSSEIRRIQNEHQDEPNLFQRSRLKGILRPTRHIGGALLKEKVAKQFLQKGCIPEPWNPPYTTSQPEITCHPILEEDKFVIIASDGLWDFISSEEAVQIVGEYLTLASRNMLDDVSVSTFLIERALSRVPICEHPTNMPDEMKDANTIHKVFEIPIPNRRNAYDDMTVTVVFLDNSRSDFGHLEPKFKPSTPHIMERINHLKSFVAVTPIFDLISNGTSPEALELKQYLKECWPKNLDRWAEEKWTTESLLLSFGIGPS